MSYTDQDVREGRRLMNEGCENRLVIGDMLLRVAPSGHDGVADGEDDHLAVPLAEAMPWPSWTEVMNSLVNFMKHVPLARDVLHDPFAEVGEAEDVSREHHLVLTLIAGNLLMLSIPLTTSMSYDTSSGDLPGAPRPSPEGEGLGGGDELGVLAVARGRGYCYVTQR